MSVMKHALHRREELRDERHCSGVDCADVE